MSVRVVVTRPEEWGVSKSLEAAQTILRFEVLVEGEKAGEPSAQLRFGLDPHDAIALGRELQDQSIQLLLSLAGYEEPTDKSPGHNERQH